MIEAYIAPANPIVFVLDPSNSSIELPQYIDGELVAANETCVSIGIQADVDGETNIQLIDKIESIEKNQLSKVFEGSITSPGNKIAVVTAEFDRVIETKILQNNAYLEIWVDDLRAPARVVVCVE